MTNLRALNWLFFPVQSILAWGLLSRIVPEKSAFLQFSGEKRGPAGSRAAGGARKAFVRVTKIADRFAEDTQQLP